MNCIFCNREILNKGSLKSHEKCCKSNPNRVIHPHSPKAGKRPGTPPHNKGIKTGRNPRWDVEFALDKVLVANSTYPRTRLRKRLIEGKIIEYKCSICDSPPIWMGNPMPLILDHINGINNDHRLQNLRFVCSNCDSQLSTYKSRNRKRVD